jgi:CRP/FNR family cyclic AMP-dependent transcriptional regulator
MSMLTNLDLLRRVPMFSMLSEDQAKTLSEAVVKRRFRRGELIVQQGQKTDALYIILAGRGRVVMNDNKGREVILATLQPGDYIGEMSMIDNEAHSASVEAEIPTDVLELGRAAFTNSLTSSASMAYAVVCGLVQRLRTADRKIGSLALMNVYGRVANVLLDAAKASPHQDMIIHEKLTRQDIAKMVGASREMVSRVMKDFLDQGFIEALEGGSMRIKERRSKPRD